jgi:hypothetical protein
MKEKGLCVTCIHDNSCTFVRKFPVLHCEEFSIKSNKKEFKKVKAKIKNIKKYKQ